MADFSNSTSTATTLNPPGTLGIPQETSQRFPELIELIKGSKSMNDEERQYWVDALPIMSEDQLQNLYSILDNEKKQLAEAAKSYTSGMEAAENRAKRAFDENAYREKKRLLHSEEAQHEQAEQAEEEAVLAEIAKL